VADARADRVRAVGAFLDTNDSGRALSWVTVKVAAPGEDHVRTCLAAEQEDPLASRPFEAQHVDRGGWADGHVLDLRQIDFI
jgi:hypothetical protein